jgi:energy-converting hydrogenase Eha subunit A
MNASFEEKSVWIQLGAMILTLGTYFIVAGRMLASGVTSLVPYVPLFIGAVVLMVMVLIVGHIVAAVVQRPDDGDERDRLISWRAESNSSWVVALGVLAAITGLVLSVENVWIAHLLLLSLVLSELTRYLLQLIYYRRGM